MPTSTQQHPGHASSCKRSVAVAASILFAAAAAAVDAQPFRNEPAVTLAPLTEAPLGELEHAFWICDYYAATRGTGPADAMTRCTAVYEAFKARRFDGDFDALLAWWQQNKPAAHARLQESDTPRR